MKSNEIFGVHKQFKKDSNTYQIASRAYQDIRVGETVYLTKDGKTSSFIIRQIEDRRKLVPTLYKMNGGLLFIDLIEGTPFDFNDGDVLLRK